jgi:hypothetical protein
MEWRVGNAETLSLRGIVTGYVNFRNRRFKLSSVESMITVIMKRELAREHKLARFYVSMAV